MTLPTIISVRANLSEGIKERWQIIQDAIRDQHVDTPPPDLDQNASGRRDRSSALSADRPFPECPDRTEGDSQLSWYSLTCDVVSVGRALRISSYQETGWPMDDDDDLYRPMDIPGL